MSINRIILKGEPSQLKPMFLMAEFLYEVCNDIEANLTSGSNELTSVPRSAHPEVFMYFLQDPTKFASKTNRTGQISFRLMQYKLSNISSLQQSTLVSIGQRIKEFFGEPAPGDEAEEFTWNKGNNMLSYSDWDNGIQLQILSNSQSDGLAVVERVLEIAEVTFLPQYANYIQNNEPEIRYPTTPTPITILGQEITPNVIRPIVSVKFQRSWVYIPGMPNKITLYDIRGKDPSALVK